MVLTPIGGDCSLKFAITTDHSNHALYGIKYANQVVGGIRYSAPIDHNYAIMAEDNWGNASPAFQS